MSNTAERKRRAVESPLVSVTTKPRAGASRAANGDRRAYGSRATVNRRRSSPRGSRAPHLPASTETIDVMDGQEDGIEEVVDLTSEVAEVSHVVDLTNNDSVLLVDEGLDGRRNSSAESYVVSDDDDVTPLPGADVLSSLQAQSSARLAPGAISCPVCMDSYSEIVESGRLVVSTKCGHVFCSQCLRDALRRSLTCPTCRKRLTSRQYHPIYI
ncbi:RING finger protein 4 isoform X2 [Phycodurus eques]|uniref:RING finger protein 4 isoform X2 n=1 Tax=Phycodurus eques TaxID=693459 RepID=UPI002ACD4409|nr:RING finger protein 4 isoform X2 [Phycodurus eques]XP_061541134.1 RING finger protein 4 isoform X2 [Phycodurus eques]